MIGSIRAVLRQLGGSGAPLEIAEAIWLASHLPVARAAEPEAVEKPKREMEEAPAAVAAEPSSTPPDEPLPEEAERAPVFVADRRQSQRRAPPASVRSLNVTGASALPRSQEIARALRPLRKRVESRHRWTVDEVRSAEQIAATRIRAPVIVPARERWLDVSLIEDGGRSMTVWREVARELRHLIERHGAFRTVRRLKLRSDDWSVASVVRPNDRRHSAEVGDAGGRSLVLVVSDCVSPAWHSGRVGELIQSWQRTKAVTIVQLLPDRLWERTALQSEVLWFRHPNGGDDTPRLRVIRDDRGEPAAAAARSRTSAVPVTRLVPLSLRRWARATAAPGMICSGASIPLPDPNAPFPTGWEEEIRVSPEEALRRFHAAASEQGRRLLSLLAPINPLTLPIMRLLQSALLPHSRHEHLAEVFLSGLLRVTSRPGDREPQYELSPGVRELLLGSMPGYEVERILRRTASYAETAASRSFGALARVSDGKGSDDGLSTPFARFRTAILKRMGVESATGADEGEQGSEDGAGYIVGSRRDWLVEAMREIGAPFDEETVVDPREAAAGLAAWADSENGLITAALKVFEAVTRSGYQQFLVLEDAALNVTISHIDEDRTRHPLAGWDSITGMAAKTKRAIYIPNTHDGSPFLPADSATQSEIAIPILAPSNRQVIGVFNAESKEIGAFDQEAAAWLERFVNGLARSLEVFEAPLMDSIAAKIPEQERQAALDRCLELVRADRFDDAFAELLPLVEDDATDIDILGILVRIAELAPARIGDAIAACARALEFFPWNQGSDSVTLLDLLVRLAPEKLEYRVRLAEVLQDNGENARAVMYLKQIADHFLRRNDTDRALETLTRIVDLDPSEVDTRKQLQDLFRYTYLGRTPTAAARPPAPARTQTWEAPNLQMPSTETAEALVKRGQISAAITEYRRVAVVSRNTDVRTLHRIADLLIRDGRNLEAADTLEVIAEHYRKNGFFLKATAVYKKITKVEPNRLSAYPQLADLYAKQGLIGEARSQYAVLADYYTKRGELSAAADCYQKIVKIDPESINNHIQLAELYLQSASSEPALHEYVIVTRMLLKRQMYTEGITVAERMLRIYLHSVSALTMLADVVVEAGDPAIELLEQRTSGETDRLPATLLLARVRLVLREFDKARALIESAKKLSKADTRVRALKKSLGKKSD